MFNAPLFIITMALMVGLVSCGQWLTAFSTAGCNSRIAFQLQRPDTCVKNTPFYDSKNYRYYNSTMFTSTSPNVWLLFGDGTCSTTPLLKLNLANKFCVDVSANRLWWDNVAVSSVFYESF
jgi:hypothetical protein